MAKKKGTVGKVVAAVQDAAATAAKAAEEHVVTPAGEALGLTGGEKATTARPAGKSAGGKSAAARVMTRGIAGKKTAAARTMTRRVADSAKPLKKPSAAAARKAPRRGASKGR
jgi:hypothetical protein